MRVIELRNYLLKDGTRDPFIRYFEDQLLFALRDEGMYPLGQFEVVGAPNRFAWVRGFDDMRARHRSLEGFYGGPVWHARRDEANAMMLEHHDVHLLRPLGPLVALTGGASLESLASAPSGQIPSSTGLVVVDFYRTATETLGRLVELFEGRVRPARATRGHRVLGHFVAELAPNDYPHLPVIQDPTLLVVVSAYRDREHHAAACNQPEQDDATAAMRALLTAETTTLCLRPTALR
jgi:quinol monooxygenase YgiN